MVWKTLRRDFIEIWRRGDLLSPNARQAALGAYRHRFTRDHKPQWANKLNPDGKPYPLQFDSDRDWLGHTYFRVDKRGALLHGARYYCQSYQTWPDNPELADHPGSAAQLRARHDGEMPEGWQE